MAEQEGLFPVFDMPELIAESEPEEEKYRTSVYWDIDTGDFKREGANRMVPSNGRDTYIQWCYKMIRTERYTHLAYPDEIGTEIVEAASQPTDQAVESMLERTISEALLVNPATDYVRDFSFSWMGDSVHVEFTVKGKDWEEFQLETTISPEEVMTDDS